MMALFLTVLVSSLVGSLHCAGMCGAFVAFAIGAGDPAARTGKGLLLAAYQAGRLVTYAILGAAAGFLGRALDLGGKLVGIERTAAVAAGALMVGFGAVTLLRLAGVGLKPLPVPSVLTRITAAGHTRAMRYSPAVRALVTGLLTTLLPCGWLYAFVITAAGTGSAWTGAALMATFWIGTLPMLTLVGIGIRRLAAPLAARLPAITALAIVAVGLYTIAARAQISISAAPPRSPAASAPADLARQVQSIDQTKLPCCAEHAAATRPEAPR